MPARRTGRWQRVLRIGHDLLPLFLILQLHKFKNTEERKCITTWLKAGKRIKALRKEHGLTQEQLAEQLGVAANTIARIETGNRGISIDLAIELVVRFETTLDYIFLGRE